MPWRYVISDLNGEEIAGTFTKNNYKKQVKMSLKLKR